MATGRDIYLNNSLTIKRTQSYFRYYQRFAGIANHVGQAIHQLWYILAANADNLMRYYHPHQKSRFRPHHWRKQLSS